MLATLVIGLREGLEAALIVGIIAAFLRTNGKSLRPMILGVSLAVALSIAVGVALDVVERSLPQTQQEGKQFGVLDERQVLIAVAIGWGIYAGGVKINLSKFFRYTGVFLILVAAGLVITALRTAHEAGWLLAGQQLGGWYHEHEVRQVRDGRDDPDRHDRNRLR